MITHAGNFEVTGPLQPTVPDADCLMIDAAGVNLNLAGNSITMPFANASDAIHLTRKAAGATVAGGGATISGSYSDGVVVESGGATLSGIKVSGATVAIVLDHARDATLSEFQADGNSGGVLIEGGGHNRLSNFSANSNLTPFGGGSYGYGVFILGSNDNSLSAFTADSNFYGVVIQGVLKSRFLRYGIVACCFPGPPSARNEITGGEATNNIYSGVSLSENSHSNEVTHVVASGNGNEDLFDFNPDCDHDFWSENTFGVASPSCVH